MADKKNEATKPETDVADDDPRNRIDLNDPHMSGQEASERALGYHKEKPKAE